MVWKVFCSLFFSIVLFLDCSSSKKFEVKTYPPLFPKSSYHARIEVEEKEVVPIFEVMFNPSPEVKTKYGASGRFQTADVFFRGKKLCHLESPFLIAVQSEILPNNSVIIWCSSYNGNYYAGMDSEAKGVGLVFFEGEKIIDAQEKIIHQVYISRDKRYLLVAARNIFSRAPNFWQYWSIDISHGKGGTVYEYSIEGGLPFPLKRR